MFKKNNFENLEKLKSIVNIFVVFIKISSQSKESPFQSNPSLLETFRPHPYCQVRGSQSCLPLCKGGIQTMGPPPVFLLWHLQM